MIPYLGVVLPCYLDRGARDRFYPDMAFVVANGVELHTQVLGEDNRSPIYMLHGLLVGNLAAWYFGAGAALAKTKRVVTYDLRGHGRSERALGGYDVANMSDDLEALASTLGDKTLSLVGHSYGGLVALDFARRRPERVDKLALIDVPLPPSRIDFFESIVARDPSVLIAVLPVEVQALLTTGKRKARRFLEGLQFLLLQSSLVADLCAEGDVSDEELGRVRCPTLLVYGSRSTLLPVAERLKKTLANATMRVLEGGHYLPSEAPQLLSDTLVEFFTRGVL